MRETTDGVDDSERSDSFDGVDVLDGSGASSVSGPSGFHPSLRLDDSPARSVLNRSVLRDRLLLALFRTLTAHRPYFRDGVESPPFEAHREAVELDLSPLDGVDERDAPSLDGDGGYEGSYDVPAETLAGSLTAGVRVARWGGVGAPTVVWHHGGGEYPFDRTFDVAFGDEPDGAGTAQSADDALHPDVPDDATLLVVRAPGHDRRGGITEVGATLSGYLATMAVAVDLTERLLAWCRPCRSVVAGYSLGGFVANRHHLAFDSADAYVPVVAGCAHAEIFLSSWPAARSARRRADRLRERLNFADEWADRDHPTVHPVVGLYDCLNRFETQVPSYGDTTPDVWPVGHFEGAVAGDRLRAAVLSRL
ncbi:hypothetical protein [Salinirubrum litoreum]|uniref:Alpha/beta hydrolase family protein n=1 Tax=Salinirubrum litoreum TaxID=1126234 RepID=A0ABD5RDM5_9EURY|nr:hypothetical protein [Salinirubrum litoreum]